MQPEVGAGAARDHAEETVGHVENQGGIGALEMHDDSEAVAGLDAGHGGEGSGLGAEKRAAGKRFRERWIDETLDGPDDVGGFERAAVVEVDAVVKMKDPCERVGLLPAGG